MECSGAENDHHPRKRKEALWSIFIYGHLISFFSLKETVFPKVATTDLNKSKGSKLSIEIQTNNTSQPNFEEEEKNGQHVTSAYLRRFWILIMYCFISMLHLFQTVKYASVSDILTCYYGVSYANFNWLSLVYSVAYVILVLPSMWLLNRYGLRITIILGATFNSLSAVIQCGSSNPDDFTIVLLSQVLSAMAMPFIMPIPSTLANTWFKSNEVCRASGVASTGCQMGAGLAFAIMPLFLQYNCSEIEEIRRGLNNEAYFIAACNLLGLTCLIFTFENKPPVPPNLAQASRNHKIEYIQSIKTLLKNFSFDLVIIVYGIIVGLFYAFNVVINEMLIPVYPHSTKETGWAMQLAYVAGAIGIITAGYILDRTHEFRKVSMSIAWLSTLAMCAFTGVLLVQIRWLQYITVATIGLFTMCYISVGFELACEIIYPESEGFSSGLLSASSLLFTILFSSAGSNLIETYGVFSCCLFFCVSLLLGSIMTGYITCDCKRTKQNMTSKENLGSEVHENP